MASPLLQLYESVRVKVRFSLCLCLFSVSHSVCTQNTHCLRETPHVYVCVCVCVSLSLFGCSPLWCVLFPFLSPANRHRMVCGPATTLCGL